MIVDTHTHFYDPTRPQGVPWPSADNDLLYRPVYPSAYKALAIPEGVSGTVVVEASKWLEDNQWILDLAHEEPFIVGFVGHLRPGETSFGQHLRRFTADPLFCGIRCGPGFFTEAPESGFVAHLRTLAANDLSLDVLIRQEHVGALLALARSIPELHIVVNHIAHMPIDARPLAPQWLEIYERLAGEPQIRMKASALPEQSVVQPAPTALDVYRPTLDALWATFGEDRLIYGSNWPVCERAGDFSVGLNVVKDYFVEKGEPAAAKFFRENAAAAYRWEKRTVSG
jgi:L-fuconolactonase